MRFSAQRLALVILLVARLAFGELAGAMPDHASAHSCPDHATQHDESCCKSACSCPCLHFSALAAPALTTQALMDDARPRMPVVGATLKHVDRLLRPPA